MTTVTSKFKKWTHYEHVLNRPDNYLGSIKFQTQLLWTLDTTSEATNASTRMKEENITFVPALYKLFDEIIVNAADNKIRDPDTSIIKVNISENGTISVFNNGTGIPGVKHAEYQDLYIPELIFGHLLTSSNYNDDEERVTGGRNGYGAKLVNIFSTDFHVETCHANVVYTQSWSNNMKKVGKPKIKSCKKKDFTCITFTPDYAKFGLTGIDKDHVKLFTRRVYDLCGTLGTVKVYLNDELIPCKSFKEYIKLFVGEQAIIEKPVGSWQVAVASSNGQFQQVSFVNNIFTSRGGTHVEHVSKQICKFISQKLKTCKPHIIKNELIIFVNCLVVNPEFDSQTKEELKTTSQPNWIKLSDAFLKKIASSEIMNRIQDIESNKQDKLLQKSDGIKKRRISGIPKLDDANEAGTKNAYKCTLFLTEGDSAKTMASQGLAAIPRGKDYFGIYPLKGKILNVRETPKTKIAENKEISELKEILGLKSGKEYTSVDSLRYGRIALLTDADTDGSHIKGLVINYFDCFFPCLLKIDGFLTEFVTPIVKCTRGKNNRVFYTLQEFRNEMPDTTGWTVKYYKGLGTSNNEEAKEYFKNIQTNLKKFLPIEDEDSEKVDLVFNKSRANDRKQWLATYDSESFLDRTLSSNKVKDFIDKDFIHFSVYDNMRSIPKLIDGLKPSQRKILYCLFKRPVTGEIKVAQLGGRTSEMTAYHHGEQSLFECIKNLACQFVGSSSGNLNLLEPRGQFGSRHKGGADAASPRYIFTCLQEYTRKIFHPHDDPILPRQFEENMEIEPEYYLPIIPIVIVNGTSGIGSAYSTDVLPCCPLQVISTLEQMLIASSPSPSSVEQSDIKPWYRGFTGSITLEGNGKWLIRGKWSLEDGGKRLVITELPIGTWTEKYKEKILDPEDTKSRISLIKDVKEHHLDDTVHFVIYLTKEITEQEAIQLFKLETKLSSNNMVLADTSNRLRKFDSYQEIIREFYEIRYRGYVQRKAWRLDKIRQECIKLENKLRFIQMILDDQLILKYKKKEVIFKELQDLKFIKVDGSFDHLLDMSLGALTREKLDTLTREHENKTVEFTRLQSTSVEELWLHDLDQLKTCIKLCYSSQENKPKQKVRRNANGVEQVAKRSRK